jgi:hypothetical protein
MEFIGNIARKTGEPSLLAVESIKTRLAREIGEESGLFYVPKVLNFDAQAGVLEFERLEGLVTLLNLGVCGDDRLFELLKKAGQALAVIHEKLVLPEEMKHELPAEWVGPPDENVFIHGDFASINVCSHEPSGQLVILDWSAAPLMGRTATFGSRYFDVLWFTSCLFHGVPGKEVFRQHPERMAETFFQSYAVNCPPDKLNRIKNYLPKICRLHRKNILYLAHRRSTMKAIAYLSCQILMYARFCRFMNKFEL